MGGRGPIQRFSKFDPPAPLVELVPSMNHWVPLVLSSAVPFVLSGSSSSRATFRPFEIAEKRIWRFLYLFGFRRPPSGDSRNPLHSCARASQEMTLTPLIPHVVKHGHICRRRPKPPKVLKLIVSVAALFNGGDSFNVAVISHPKTAAIQIGARCTPRGVT